MSVSASESDASATGDRTAKSGRHTPESAQRFWMRMIAGGSAKSLRSVGSLLALATAGAFVAALVGGIWYLAVSDLLDDTATAATSAIAGGVVIWLVVIWAGARAILGVGNDGSSRLRRRHRSG